ncbi:hypothetical protein KI387_002778, partial [Taxus chinensis]
MWSESSIQRWRRHVQFSSSTIVMESSFNNHEQKRDMDGTTCYRGMKCLCNGKNIREKMSLRIHCHISGGQWLLDTIVKLRFYIFRKELLVVLEAFKHDDKALFEKHPELEDAL